jgi:hypothetical protein
MPRLDQLRKDYTFDRFEICAAYHALEYDWNEGGWVRERPSCQRRLESIGVQLARMQYRPPMDLGGWHSLLPDEDFDDEHAAARESYIHALIAWGLAPQVDADDDIGSYVRQVYVPEFVAEHFPHFQE